MTNLDQESQRLHNNLRQQAPQSSTTVKTQANIRDNRFRKEMDLIRLNHEFQLQQNSDGSKDIVFLLNYKYVEKLPFVIHLSKEYPFVEPTYTFDPPQGFISRQDNKNQKDISELLGPWSPGMRLSEIATKALDRIEKTLVNQGDVHKNLIYRITGSPHAFYLIITFSIVLRLLTGLGGYSGENDPPNYGDFEAHRNWMSLTYRRKAEAWYREPTQNIWWRLDYPPFAGYLSYFFAMFMRIVVPEGLVVQRGFESTGLRLFMRMTVLASDLLFFYVPVIILLKMFKLNQRLTNTLLLLILCVPGFVLVDHGHFQYNCVMLGLVLAAYIAIVTDHDFVACALFSVALSTKQMSMYYALAYFGILLGRAMFSSNLVHPMSYKTQLTKHNLIRFGISVFSYAWVVIIVTITLWLPWISFSNINLILEPLSAIFPVHRGLYQLKVANFWCVTDVLMKWEIRFSTSLLLLMAVILNLIFCAPSVIACIATPKPRIYLQALLNISLAFFFFSYHVHEKTVLVPLLFVAFNWRYLGKMALDFVMLASFSMYHLMKMDNQILQYFALNMAYLYFGTMAMQLLYDMKYVKPISDQQLTDVPEKFRSGVVDLMRRLAQLIEINYYKFARKLVYAGIVVLHVLDAVVQPPQNLPYLIHLLFAVLAFLVFCVVFVYSNLTMSVAAYEKIVKTITKHSKRD